MSGEWVAFQLGRLVEAVTLIFRDPPRPHDLGCAQLEKRPCPNAVNGAHWWSGWPGAYCTLCGDEDKNEVCLAGCRCHCHDKFWEEYAAAVARDSKDGDSNDSTVW